MDRAELSESIVAELGELFVETLRSCAQELLRSDFDGLEQRLQALGRTVLGRVVEQTVATIAEGQVGEGPVCRECAQPMRLVDPARPRSLQGLVGDYAIRRPYYVCDRCHQGHSPLDEQLGLGLGALSPGLQRVACRLGIDDSFGDAVDVLRETLRIELASEANRRITEGIGQVAEDEAQALIARAVAGQEPFSGQGSGQAVTSATLLVEVDGALVHEVDGQWHEVKSGLAAPLGPKVQEDKETKRTVLEMGRPSYCVGFESAEAFWYRVYVEACRRGLGTALVTLCVVLGDGAEWIWHYARAFLAVEVGTWRVKVIEILDIYHAFEHLGKVAEAVFGQGSSAAKEWVEPLRGRLEEEGPGPILEALETLRALTPAAGEASEEVRKALAYFRENAARMDYPTYRALQLPIGSGAIESACKTLIEEREKGAGMRWSQKGAQTVATLRALHRSGRWDSFWKRHPQRLRPAVNPRKPNCTAIQEPARQTA